MNDYIQVDIVQKPTNQDEIDILDALLCDCGFESFVPIENGVSAFVKKELFDENAFKNVFELYEFSSEYSWTSELIIGKDWNEEWEKNFFKPMVIADKCVIHSSFHTDYPKMEYDITIDPKMAFGTGHHSTTNLIVTELLSMSLLGKNILDMGTGTGILSIVGVLHGAESAIGIEIDEAAYVNALENIDLNKVSDKITILKGDASQLNNYNLESFDIVLANINRNVILDDIDKYASMLKPNGFMLLSGFYREEAYMLIDAGRKHNLEMRSVKENNNWALVVLKKTDSIL